MSRPPDRIRRLGGGEWRHASAPVVGGALRSVCGDQPGWGPSSMSLSHRARKFALSPSVASSAPETTAPVRTIISCVGGGAGIAVAEPDEKLLDPVGHPAPDVVRVESGGVGAGELGGGVDEGAATSHGREVVAGQRGGQLGERAAWVVGVGLDDPVRPGRGRTALVVPGRPRSGRPWRGSAGRA